jgi:uncharacterized protein (DUF58 family)
VQLVLDNDRSSHEGSGPWSSLEWSIRIAASYLEAWISQGAAVELVISGLRMELLGGSVAVRRAKALDTLARLTTDKTLPLDEVLQLPACRRFRGGLRLVVCTDQSLDRLAKREERGRFADRFVVLNSTAFSNDQTKKSTTGSRIEESRTCIWVDDPDRVAQQVQRGWRESGHEF